MQQLLPLRLFRGGHRIVAGPNLSEWMLTALHRSRRSRALRAGSAQAAASFWPVIRAWELLSKRSRHPVDRAPLPLGAAAGPARRLCRRLLIVLRLRAPLSPRPRRRCGCMRRGGGPAAGHGSYPPASSGPRGGSAGRRQRPGAAEEHCGRGGCAAPLPRPHLPTAHCSVAGDGGRGWVVSWVPEACAVGARAPLPFPCFPGGKPAESSELNACASPPSPLLPACRTPLFSSPMA